MLSQCKQFIVVKHFQFHVLSLLLTIPFRLIAVITYIYAQGTIQCILVLNMHSSRMFHFDLSSIYALKIISFITVIHSSSEKVDNVHVFIQTAEIGSGRLEIIQVDHLGAVCGR